MSLIGLSKRQKLVGATIVLVAVLLGITLLSLFSFSTTQQKLKQVTEQYQPKMLSALQLTNHFYHSLSVLGNYLIEKDTYNMELYKLKVEDIDATLDELVRLSNDNRQLDDAQQLNRIHTLVAEIKAYNSKMLNLAQDVNKNLPAIGIATERLEPIGISMNQVLNDLIVISNSNDNADLSNRLAELRYNWSMVVSEVRNYLAFRNENTIQEFTLYNIGVDQSIDGLMKSDSILDEEQLELLDEFKSQLSDYRSYLTRAISIHASNEWREDRLLMRQSISPTLRRLTQELEGLVLTQQKRINQSNRELSAQIDGAEQTIRISIQVVVAITIVAIVLSMRNQLLVKNVKVHKENEIAMRHKAHHDALTGLPNRAYFYDRLYQLLNDNNNQSRFALLFIDLDGFKTINDTVGHDAGDYILVESANRLNALVRTSDLVARLGGDEFTVILDRVVTENVAELLSEKICTSLNEPYIFKGQSLKISASIGFTYSKHNAISKLGDVEERVELIVKQADSAMYAAKNGGKNQYRRFI